MNLRQPRRRQSHGQRPRDRFWQGAGLASDKAILNSKIGPNEIHLHKSNDHHLDWLTSIRTRQPAVTTPEEAHRSTSACILGWIAMKLGRKLRWDPAKEAFADDDEANAMRSRPQRAPYGIDRLLKNT